MEKLFRNIILCSIICGSAFGMVSGCISKVTKLPQPKEIIKYVPTPDTMSIQEVIFIKEQLRRTQDSLKTIKHDTVFITKIDSTINGELFVAKYKLERIRYYNNIAKNGNNIKYLRGWINRVLTE